MNSRSSYIRGVSWGALSFGFTAFLGVFTSIITARVYGVRVLGEFALASAPATVVWHLSSVREQAALVKRLSTMRPQEPRVTGVFAAVMTFSVALTIVVALIGLGATWLLFHGIIGHPQLFAPAAAGLAGYLVFTNTGWNLDMVFSGFRAGKELSLVRLTQALSFLAAAIAGGLAWGSVWSLVGATVLSYGVSLGHRLVLIRRYMRFRTDRDSLRQGFAALPEMLRFGLKITPGGIADGLASECGTWVLGAVGTLAELGAYNRAWQLGRRFLELNWRITEMLFPTLVERRAAGDASGHDRALVDSMRYSLVGMLLPAAAGAGAADGVMRLFGAGFDQAAGALALLLLVPALSTVTSIQTHALYADDRPSRASVGSILRMGVTFALSVPLGISFGATGIALSLLLAFAVQGVWLQVQLRRHVHLALHGLWPARERVIIPASYAAGFVVARGLWDAFPSYFGLAGALAGGSLAYAAVFLAGGGINQRDRARLAGIRARLGRSRLSASTDVS